MGWLIENRIAEYTLRISNAYLVGQLSLARKLEKELAAYKEKPQVKVYLLSKK